MIPESGYLRKVKDICEKYNVLLITDEVQTGLGRTGKLMCYEHDLGDTVKPDICTVGKAISGGITPVSGILASREVMTVIGRGEHGSTYGGNPLGMAIAKAAVKAVVEEDMVGNSARLGAVLKKNLLSMQSDSSLLRDVRARGLFAAIEFRHDLQHGAAAFIDIMFKQNFLVRGVGSNPAVIRFAPPLVINENEVDYACEAIQKGLKTLESM